MWRICIKDIGAYKANVLQYVGLQKGIFRQNEVYKLSKNKKAPANMTKTIMHDKC